jgi:hypothetical protein
METKKNELTWEKVAEFIEEHGYRMVRSQRKRGPGKTLEEVAAFLKTKGCTLLTKRYFHSAQPLDYRCDKCGTTYRAVYNNLYRTSHYCRKCWISESSAKQLHHFELRQKLFSIVEAAKWLGVHYDDFYKHVRYTKLLPAPTRIATVTGRQRFYSKGDLQRIKRMIKIDS